VDNENHSAWDHVKVLWYAAPFWMRATLVVALLWAVYKYFSIAGLLEFALFCFLVTGTIFAIAGVSGENLAGMQNKMDSLVDEIRERVSTELARLTQETIVQEEVDLQVPQEDQPEEQPSTEEA